MKNVMVGGCRDSLYIIATPPPVLDVRGSKSISYPFGTNSLILTLSELLIHVSEMNIKSAFFSTIMSFISRVLLPQDLALQYRKVRDVVSSTMTSLVSMVMMLFLLMEFLIVEGSASEGLIDERTPISRCFRLPARFPLLVFLVAAVACICMPAK